MRNDVAHDMQKSSYALHRLVIPALMNNCPEFGRTKFEAIENPRNADGLRKRLDVLAGIDGYQYWSLGMRGIAARVQQEPNFRTFSIREKRPEGTKTELERRLYTLKNKDKGCLSSYWTLQAYTTEGYNDLLSVGLAKTEELYRYIERYEASGKRFPRRRARNGGEQFLYVDWDLYKRSGYYFFEHAVSQRNTITFTQQARHEEAEDVFTRQSYRDLFECELGMAEADRILHERDLDELRGMA